MSDTTDFSGWNVEAHSHTHTHTHTLTHVLYLRFAFHISSISLGNHEDGIIKGKILLWIPFFKSAPLLP